MTKGPLIYRISQDREERLASLHNAVPIEDRDALDKFLVARGQYLRKKKKEKSNV